jgi:ActR/RegA family two-component response regulator
MNEWCYMKKRDRVTREKKTLMIVEDFDYVRNLIGRYFQQDGFEIISAGTMQEAMSIAQYNQPQVVIVDFDMSNDPYVIVSILHNILPLSRIIIINGRKRDCNTEDAKTAGANQILDRLYNPQALEGIIHDLVSELVPA